jgi:tRNA threonylcarbamoyladenosine biosynthesis protein TsaB
MGVWEYGSEKNRQPSSKKMILLIDTSGENGSVSLAKGGEILFSEDNYIAKDHASWLHMAIGRILEQAKITVRDLEAVAVVAGPGSYTGLRVGMAAAKGLCYALKIPLITQNTLRVMAESMQARAREKAAWICPLIDARRYEVFTALYQTDMQEVMAPQALILDKSAFEGQLSRNPIVFFGSGAEKLEKILNSPAAIFESQPDIKQAFAHLSEQDFISGTWADPVYTEPVYLKEFFSY